MKSVLVSPLTSSGAEAVPQQLFLLQPRQPQHTGPIPSDPSSDSPVCCSLHPPRQWHPSRMLDLHFAPTCDAAVSTHNPRAVRGALEHRGLMQLVPCQRAAIGESRGGLCFSRTSARPKYLALTESVLRWLLLPAISPRKAALVLESSCLQPTVARLKRQPLLCRRTWGCSEPDAPMLVCLGRPCSSKGQAFWESQSHWACEWRGEAGGNAPAGSVHQQARCAWESRRWKGEEI